MRVLASLLLAGSLAACSTPLCDALDTRQNAGPCPPAGALYDAARIIQFGDGSETYDNIAYTGEIVDVRLFCRYADGEPMDVEVEIDFAFGKGAVGTANTHAYTYFVAVTRRNAKVLNKERFAIQADFSERPVTGGTTVIRPITVPRADETISGANFEIVVGFELTEDQLEFNRAGNRFRLDAGR